jgi:hypothetical protein
MTYAQTADLLLTNLVGEKSSQNYENKSAVYASRLTSSEFKKAASDDLGSEEAASAERDSSEAVAASEGRASPPSDEDIISKKDDTVSNVDSECKEVTHSNGAVEYYCTGVDVELPPAIDDCVDVVINDPEAVGEYAGNSDGSSGEKEAIYHDIDNSIGRCHWIEPVMPDPGFCGINQSEPEGAGDKGDSTAPGSSSGDAVDLSDDEVITVGERIEGDDDEKGKELLYVEPMECTEPIMEKLEKGETYSGILKDVLIQLLGLFDEDMDGKLDKSERKEAVTVILKAMLD